MLDQPNWDHIREQLLLASERAIAWYCSEHGDESCSYFGYGCIPEAGDVYVGFDTENNSRCRIQESSCWVIERVRRYGDRPGVSYGQHSMLQKAAWFPLIQEPDMFGDIAYQTVERLCFNELPEYAQSADCPQPVTPGAWLEGRYTEGRLAMSFCQVVEELERRHAFALLPRASIFLVGYSFHDDTPVTLRVYV